MTTIKLKNGSGAPTAGDLVQGEPALDLTNKRLYTEDSGGTVIEVGTNPSTINIDAGTIDGAVIGGSSAAAITGTTITGTSFVSSGNMTFGDNDKAIFGAGSDLQIYHDGSNSYIAEGGTGELLITSNGTGIRLQKNNGENMIKALTDGAVQLYYDNQDKLATTSTGIDVTGVITTDGMTTSADINFGDNDKAVFGAGSDLEIFHDGSNSYVKENGTGNLWVTSNGTSVGFGNNDLSELYAVFNNDGEAKLFFNGVQKFATSSTGIDVTGTVTADGGLIEGSTGLTIRNDAVGANEPKLVFDNDTFAGASHAQIQTGNGGLQLLIESPSTSTFQNRHQLLLNGGGSTDVTFKLSTDNGTSYKNQLQINNNDISFYEDTGTTAKLFWDASAESLGIGTSSPSALLEVATPSSGSAAVFNLLDNTADGFVVKQGSNEYISVDTTNAAEVITLGNTTTIADVIVPAGNVGIGTTSPAAALSLASGTADSNGIKMQASGWPHYVRSGINGTTGSQFIQSTNWNANTNTVDSASHATTALILDTSSGSIQFRTATTNTVPTERMRISSGGNVGINTTSPAATLHTVANSGTTALLTVGASGNNIASFYTSGSSQVMTLDSSGNLLVGKTNTTFSTSGIELREGNSGARFIRSNAEPVLMNRTGSDGKILGIYKDGTTVGSIGSLSGTQIVIDSGGNRSGVRFEDNGLLPRKNSAMADGTVTLGNASYRFSDLYLSGGVYLGGTGSANKLDDYEEGTFTPTISSGTVTYTAQRGRYTKIGRVVYIHAFVQIASISGSSGTAIISGLPFVAKNDSNYSALASKTNGFNWGGSATMITFQVTPNTAVIGAVGSGNNIAFNDVNSSGLAAGDWIACTGHYVTDS